MTVLLTRSEVAAVTHTSDSTIKRWEATGALPRVKLGRPKPTRVRDNRPVRYRVKDVAALAGVAPEDIYTALATAEVGDQK